MNINKQQQSNVTTLAECAALLAIKQARKEELMAQNYQLHKDIIGGIGDEATKTTELLKNEAETDRLELEIKELQQLLATQR